MLDKATLDKALAELALKESPLTTVAAGEYPRPHVDAFIEQVKAHKSKALNDMVRSFTSGRAAHRRCIWIKTFRLMACEHFGVHNFADFFTPDGKDGQKIAMDLHRQRARQCELDKKAPKAAKELAARIQQVYKIAALYKATLTPNKGGIKVEMPTKLGPLVFTVGKKGVAKPESLES